MWKKVLKAARFAKVAHKGQTRAHGAPYFEHPKAVARILWDHWDHDTDLICAAYLHDIIEDCNYSYAELVVIFGVNTAFYVDIVTKYKGMSLIDYYQHIKDAGESAMALKMADRAHNNSELKHLNSDNPIIEKANKKTELMLKIFLPNT